MAGKGRVGDTDFNPAHYGAAGFGMQDIAELQRRGHNYNEINDYANSLRERGNINIGGKVGEWQDSEGRKWQESENQRLKEEAEAEKKRGEAKDRTAQYTQQAEAKRNENKAKYEQGFQNIAGTEQREFAKKRSGGDFQKEYNFSNR